MQHINTLDELKALDREKGLQLLAYKEQNGVLYKFVQRIAPDYVFGNQVMVFSLLKDLNW